MIKKILIISVFLAPYFLNAQSVEHVAQFDKPISHNIGFQANLLMQQLIPGTGSAGALNNPFFLKYGLRFNEPNLEIHFGGGFSENKTKNGDLTTSNFNLPLRLGVSKKYYLAKRFEAGVGFDLVTIMDQSSSETESSNNDPFFPASHRSETSVKSTSYGGGPQFTLAFYINKNIRIGTEATGYFLYQEQHQSALVEQTFMGITQEIVNESSSSFSNNFNLTLPVAMFLTVRF
jgi:hypothetical protein